MPSPNDDSLGIRKLSGGSVLELACWQTVSAPLCLCVIGFFVVAVAFTPLWQGSPSRFPTAEREIPADPEDSSSHRLSGGCVRLRDNAR